MGYSGPWVMWSLPWRPPDIARFARTSPFQELHTAAVDWIEQQFAYIGAHAEALVPAARSVSDFGAVIGSGSAASLALGKLAIRFGAFAYLEFSRQVAVVYGFDGAVSDRIADVLGVARQAGWDMYVQKARAAKDRARQPDKVGPPVPPANGAAVGRWVGAASPPHRRLIVPGWEDRPGPHQFPPGLLRVAWISRTDPSPVELTVSAPARPDARDPRSYLGLEMIEPIPPLDLGHFAAPALEGHEHAVAVLVELDYYHAQPGSPRPRDVPRRLLPRAGHPL